MGYQGASGPLVPGRRLGRGGEGEVFALADGTRRALKIYTSPDAGREAKVLALASAQLARRCPEAAFPQEAAYAADGSFAGFVMSLVEGGEPIHELCSPGSRRRTFPNADWRFLVRTALNIARVFGRVHATGAVIGDVNGSGLLVSRQAIVSLIDADSFQWGSDHPCRVGVPEFTPPELQGQNLDGVLRTVEHDCFGLAVLIFQLLFLGRHPFAGVPKGRAISLGEAITRNLFAYSRVQSPRQMPPRGTLLLPDLPLGLALLFERAFVGFGTRPTPDEWVVELGELETTVVACDRKEGHHKPTPSGDCPWCRMERVTFGTVFGNGTAANKRISNPTPITPARTRTAIMLERAKSESGEAVRPRRRSSAPRPSDHAVETLRLCGLDVGGMRLLVPKGAPMQRFETMFRKARRDMDVAIDDWRTRIGAWSAARLAAEVRDVAAQRRKCGLGSGDADVQIADLARERFVVVELARLALTVDAVPGLGARGLARLAEAGITHAGHLSRSALCAVPGVGERGVVALLLWRDRATVAIRRSATIPPEELDAVRRRLLEDEARADQRLARLTHDLEAALHDVAARADLPDAEVDAAILAYEQAVADLRHLGMSTDPAPTGSRSTKSTTVRKVRKP